MGTTNRAEEILKKHTNINRDWIDCSVVDILYAMEEYRQSEIDELTKEVERLRKGIDWTRAEYIKCVNDSDEITEKLEELLTTH